MRTVEHARERGRLLRREIGEQAEGLATRIRAFLRHQRKVRLLAVTPKALAGSSAELTGDGLLSYDERLDADPAEWLWVIAHEMGHLELHKNHLAHTSAPDLLLGAQFVGGGSDVIGRYNPRSLREAEANAFAAEFLLPCPELFERWASAPEETSKSLATATGLKVALIRRQLVAGLYYHAAAGRTPPVLAAPTPPNDMQKEAAHYLGGPCLVLAGPGTGKTATLIHRVAFLLTQQNVKPEALLILTFSNEAADELLMRIESRFGTETATQITISTFHGFGYALLLAHGGEIGVKLDAAIIDETREVEIMTRAIGQMEDSRLVSLKDPTRSIIEIGRHLRHVKEHLCPPDVLEAEIDEWEATEGPTDDILDAREFLDLYRHYERVKREANALDYSDMIAMSIDLLEANCELRRRLRDQYQHVLIDEYQDVSRSMAALIQRLCGPGNPPWVVGDQKQAIYAFRGASAENIIKFKDDFPGAQVFYLVENYRAAEAIVTGANQLASLLEDPELKSTDFTAHYKACGQEAAFAGPPIEIIAAESDAAEYLAIAEQVVSWIAAGVKPGEITILARRNLDVRNIMLALARNHIPAATSGLLTQEGPAGDLTLALAFADTPAAAQPRLFYMLARGSVPPSELNATIAEVLAQPEGETGTRGRLPEIEREIEQVGKCFQEEFFQSDSFSLLSAFLFDATGYLRRMLTGPEEAGRAVAVSEILSVLGKAAGYRLSHPKVTARVARLGFGEFLRTLLTGRATTLQPPPPDPARVRVMTCHAAKGLEFPFVIVAGQTLASVSDRFDWLPPTRQPNQFQAIEQANALFFVAFTRAKRAARITYATNPRGATSGEGRTVTPLLSRWRSVFEIPQRIATGGAPSVLDIEMTDIWGGRAPGAFTIRHLDRGECMIRTYLEQFVRIRFAATDAPLYPVFLTRLRAALSKVVAMAGETGGRVGADGGRAIFANFWPAEDYLIHPLGAFYRNIGLRATANFAEIFTPPWQGGQGLDVSLRSSIEGGGEIEIPLGLIAHIRDTDGAPTAIALWLDNSLASKRAKKGRQGVLWSGVGLRHRISFSLLRDRYTNLQVNIYSARDRAILPFEWSRNPASMHTCVEQANERLVGLLSRRFKATIKPEMCDRCRVRLSCPYFLGALD